MQKLLNSRADSVIDSKLCSAVGFFKVCLDDINGINISAKMSYFNSNP